MLVSLTLGNLADQSEPAEFSFIQVLVIVAFPVVSAFWVTYLEYRRRAEKRSEDTEARRRLLNGYYANWVGAMTLAAQSSRFGISPEVVQKVHEATSIILLEDTSDLSKLVHAAATSATDEHASHEAKMMVPHDILSILRKRRDISRKGG